MATIDVEFKLNPEIAGPLDARNQGLSTARPTGLYLYEGLVRYETDSSTLKIYDGSQFVDAGTKIGALTTASGITLDNVISTPGGTLETDQILETFKDGAYNAAGSEQTHATDDYVQNAMGRIPSGMTIAQMRTKFTKLDHLISAMLNVAAVPATSPAISGTSFSLSGQGSTTVTLGSSTSRTWTVSLNRGQWSPLASTDGSGSPTSNTNYPYGVMTACTLTNPFNSGATVICTIASTTGQTMTAATTQSWTPTSMAAVTMSNISATTAAGTTVYNNKGTQVSASPVALKNDWDINNAVTYRPEAPVYVGSSATTTTVNTASANSGQSNQAATQNMTLQTSIVYVPSHTYSDYVRFVRNPQTVRQWNSVSQSWQTAAISSSNYTITSGNQSIGSATVTYYTWQWTGIARGDTDLKFTF